MGKITVALDPEQRRAHVDRMLGLDGLGYVREDPNAVYCPIPLTSTPDDLKPELKRRQDVLMRDVLAPAGLKAYDPGSAPFSPDVNLASQPNEVYTVDSGKIAGARYFSGHLLLPSNGVGAEQEKAKTLNRIAVMFLDAGVRVSRMQPHRTIYLQYEDFPAQASEFRPVFELLREFEPGMGFNGTLPVLLGFEKSGKRIVDLEETVYREFPHLQYRYEGTVPIVKLRAENPELFFTS